MHPVEYEQYLSLAPPKGQLPMSSQADIETQQSVVSTIKSKYSHPKNSTRILCV